MASHLSNAEWILGGDFNLVKWVEDMLEAIRPGSRPKGGPKPPKPGDKSVETGPETKEQVESRGGKFLQVFIFITIIF